MSVKDTQTILAIETSCDDTSVAIIKSGILLSNVISSQLDHTKYGGVIPELASRAHDNKIMEIVDAALTEADITLNDLSAVAFTLGPGLLGSLLVGVTFGKSLAYGLGIPIITINHMEAHILAHFIEEPKPMYPFLCLTVSGGHTQIVRVDSPFDMTEIGKTLDDSAGEAFDKVGKMLGLPYPAGPHIDRLAQLGTPKYHFTKPKVDGLNFSFSGFKTAVLYFLKDRQKENPDFIKENLHDLCRSVQDNIIEILCEKLVTASSNTGLNRIAIAGGVSANSSLRRTIETIGKEKNWQCFVPKPIYCTDNAGMIAIAAHFNYLEGKFSDFDVQPNVRWAI